MRSILLVPLWALALVAQATPEACPFTPLLSIEHRPCEDQGLTGTCWSYSTTSFLETEARRLRGVDIDLSEIWMARMAYPEKARRALAREGPARFTEGGLSHDVLWVVRTHGLVPVDAYPGRPAEHGHHDHEELYRVLQAMVQAGSQSRPGASARWHAAFASVLDAYLGTPPSSFEVSGTLRDPKSYAAEVVGLPFEDYVEVMSDASKPWGPGQKLEVPDNWMGDSGYLNVDLETFMAGIQAALARGFTVVFDLDVSEPGFAPLRGTATLPDDQEAKGAITQAIRDAMFRSGATTDDHLMHVVGLARHEDGRLFFDTKDSGGAGRGPYQGRVLISENYARAKVLAYMVHQDAAPRHER
jgi:bleomycin hydrolase